MKRTIWLLGLVLFSAALATADAPRVGVVTGTVLDPDGKPTPGVTVQLVSERGAESAVSNADGGFKFAFIIPDEYTVRADLSGFQPAEGRIVVSAGGRADVVLQLAKAMGEEILVTGEAPLVNKFDVSGGGAVDAKDVQSTVAPQRYYLSLIRFFPGVSPSLQGGVEGQDVEGMTTYHQNYYVDGVDTSFARWGGSSVLRLPNVAVGQMQMTSTRQDAEFSRSLGSVTNAVVKSGTNDFHGDVSATFQNLAWNEQYEMFPQQELRDEVDVRWEAAIGGPIVKDKLWFFAAAADQGLLALRIMPSGARVDADSIINSAIAKLDFRPSASHSFALTVADTPTEFVYLAGAAEPYAASSFEQGGKFGTLRWSWAISDDLFLDTALAYQETYDNRTEYMQHANDPAGAPWSPAANNDIAYFDLATNLTWNYIAISRPGNIDHPREQGNVSLNWFAGKHDLKLGVDYQQTGWRDNTASVPVIYGRTYNYSLPGGFTTPSILREFTGTGDVGGVESESETWGVFARDRMSLGDHWTFNLGVRLDDQTHSNDVGTEVFQSTDVAPRLTAVYDVHGDSRLLLTAGAARYFDWIPMELAGRFNAIPSGRNEYDQYTWSAAQRNFINPRHVKVAENIASNTIQPATKDEVTVGAEWQFHPNWAVRANALYYEARDQYTEEPQILVQNGVNTLANVYENLDDGKLDRTSLSFILRRRFLNNWTMTASYTWSSTEGNCYSVYNSWCGHGYGAYRDVTNADGVPLSVVNRDGSLPNDLTHDLKLRGNYLFQLGNRHTINVGGFARYQSGSRWNLLRNVTMPAPGITPVTNITITEYLEPAGSRELEDVYQIDLNGSWHFPIGGRFSGSFLVEVLNVTNEQELLFATDAGRISGNPWLSVANYNIQSPREYRALVTLSF